MQDNRLNEYRMEVFISDSQLPILPHLVLPVVDYDQAAQKFLLTASRLNNVDNIASSLTDMNVTVLCLNKYGKVMFQRSGADPSNIRFTSTEAIFAPSMSKDFVIQNVTLPPDDYFLITVFTRPVQVSFSSNQNPIPVTYNCMGNKLATNKGFTAQDNSAASTSVKPVQLNAFTTDIFDSSLSPLDIWKYDLSGDGFITCYDCNGNPTVALSVFRDVILFMEFELKRRLS